MFTFCLFKTFPLNLFDWIPFKYVTQLVSGTVAFCRPLRNRRMALIVNFGVKT